MEENISFEEWFDSFREHARAMGYNGPIDQDTFASDHQAGIDPYLSAEAFVNEMNDL